MEQPVKKGWWSRNWKWFVPVGCLGILAVIVIGIVLIITLVFGAIKSSDVYQEAMSKAKSSPEVVAELGQPIESGWLVSGEINVNGASGQANLSIPISGPKNPETGVTRSGTVYAVASKSAGQWKYTTLEVEVEGRSTRINLMAATR